MAMVVTVDGGGGGVGGVGRWRCLTLAAMAVFSGEITWYFPK